MVLWFAGLPVRDSRISCPAHFISFVVFTVELTNTERKVTYQLHDQAIDLRTEIYPIFDISELKTGFTSEFTHLRFHIQDCFRLTKQAGFLSAIADVR